MHADHLLAHSDFVHRLARSLLADPHEAEDVAQQTLLEALRQPPTGDIGRAWLATVARNLARKARRGLTRKVDRERRAARSELVVSTAAILEREEQRRRLVDLVLSLGEPYRTTILLRYFHDLPARRIARDLGVPVEAVHTRLKRARRQLRECLQAEDPSDWTWSVAPFAFAPCRDVGIWPVLRGALGWIRTQPGAALCALSILVTSASVLLLETGVQHPQQTSLRALLSPEPESARPVMAALGRTYRSQEAPPEPAPSASFQIFGRVMDQLRQGVEDTVVTITGENREEHRIDAFSGWFELEDIAPGKWHVRAEAPGFWSKEVGVEITDEDPPPLEMLMERLRVAVRLETPAGDLLTGEHLMANVAVAEPPVFNSQIDRSDFAFIASKGPLTSVPELLTRMHPDELFLQHPRALESSYFLSRGVAGRNPVPADCLGVIDVWSSPPFHLNLCFRQFVLASVEVKERRDIVTFVVDPWQVSQQLASVKMRVVDAETGEPIPDVEVWLIDDDTHAITDIGNPRTDTEGRIVGRNPRTDVEGRIELRNQLPGVRYVWLRHEDYESFDPATRDAPRLRIPPGEVLDVGTVRLGKPSVIEGIVKDADGEPVQNAHAWCQRLDWRRFPQPLFYGKGDKTEPSGRFTLKDVGRGPYAVYVAYDDGKDLERESFPPSRYAINPVIVRGFSEETKVEVTLQPGTEVTVFAPRMEGRWPVVEILDSRGIPVWYAELAWVEKHSAVGPYPLVFRRQGLAAIDPEGHHAPKGEVNRSIRVLPGRYTVHLYDDLELLETRQIEVGTEAVEVVFE